MTAILVYGSTYLTTLCCAALIRAGHIVCGYVPNAKEPTVPGDMANLMRRTDVADVERTRCDVALSIQYDRQIVTACPAFNVHTGLLPEWGGSDILYHTLREGATEQGATFHAISARWDAGPVISRITYPVLPSDTVIDLYGRLAAVLPGFVVASFELLTVLGLGRAWICPATEPRLFRRGEIDPVDVERYRATRDELRAAFK